MGAVVSAILSWLFGAFARLFVVAQMHFTATKIVLVTIFMLLFPVVINNIIYEVLDIFLKSLQERIATVNIDTTLFHIYQFTGLAGWLLAKFKIPESFSVVISAIAVSFTLRSIPLVRW